MSSMLNTAAPYAFPRMKNLEELKREADQAREAQLEAAFNEAIAKGINEGIARGRVEAQTEAQLLRDRGYREGLEQGRAEGLAEMREAAGALSEAVARVKNQGEQFSTEAEAFCVDLALAMVARLVEVDSIKTEFIVKSIRAAVRTLAPEEPTAVYLHPEVRARVAHQIPDLAFHDDDSLAPGSARVEARRLLVQSSIDEAFEQIRGAILELKANRRAALADSDDGGIDAAAQ